MSKIDFLKPLANFQYSVNLEYDYDDEQKIKSYLPTSSSLSIIEDIILSTQDKSTARARLLTGAYGKGKSHMTLTMIALLSGADKKLFKNLLAKAKTVNLNTYNNILQYIDSGKKLLPVIVNGTTMDLKSNLLNSLSNSLQKNNLSSLMPNTFFDSAISKIENWKTHFEDTYKKFEKAVGYSGDEFIFALRQYDQSKYNLFVAVYPTLTAGSEFNPLHGTDVIKIYESVVDELKNYGYNGIYIVYDEFGKFLEGSVDTGSAMDIKLVQDLAEKCTRSESKQLHVLLISHKGIDNYVGRLPKEKVDAWKAVSNRYTTISIQSKDAEVFEMIAQVLKKDISFNPFLAEHTEQFCALEQLIRPDNKQQKLTGAFNEVISQIGTEFVEDCYPLHPYSLLMLPKISELVAQNERTIFTYLSSSEKNSVSYFAKRCSDEFPLIEPDQIYDYFEPLFKGESYGSDIRKYWQIATSAIAKLAQGNQLAIKIVKTISLIYIIDQFEILPPSLDLLFEIYSNHDSVDISAAIEFIKHEQLLIELQFKPYVRIKESSGNDVFALVRDERTRIEGKIDRKRVLAQNMATQYFYPVEYNDSLEITRFFRFEFLEYNELISINDIESYISAIDSDGAIIAILLNDIDEKDAAEKKIKELTSKRVIFIMPKEPKDITNHLLDFCAVSNLISKKSNDLVLVEELTYIRDDLMALINDYIETQYLKPELRKTDYYNEGAIVDIRRKTGLSHMLSRICYSVYSETPIVVNENINKNCLSAPMKAARAKIIDGLLSPVLKPYLGLVGSQDINVLRSVFVVPNIINDIENPIVLAEAASDKFPAFLQIIKEFILSSANQAKSFSELYAILISPVHNIGMKKGLIPFYLAAVIRLYKQHLVIKYKGNEIKINAELLSDINEKPDAYQIRIENWDDSKEQYIMRLESIFSKFTNSSEKDFSTFDYIIRAMQRWYLQLAKFDKETKQYCSDEKIKKLSQSEIRFKNTLGVMEINAREFLFEKLASIFGTSDYNEITASIAEIKAKLDNNIKNYISITSKYLLEILGGKGSLASCASNYYESLNDTTKAHVFSGKEDALMDSLKQVNNDEELYIRTLIKNLFSLRIEDFTDDLVSQINDAIGQAKDGIDKFNRKAKDDTGTSSYKVVFANEDGTESVLHFDKEEASPKAKLLYNDITTRLDEFADSITSSEKGQILLEIIKELCK